MSLYPHESFADRRARLAAEIARQRVQLAFAYRNLEKPIHYAETGLRGFGFLRKNSWILMAAPAVFSIASTLFGLRKGATASRVSAARRERRALEAEVRRPKGLMGHAVKWGGHGWRLFKLYRRFRPLLFP